LQTVRLETQAQVDVLRFSELLDGEQLACLAANVLYVSDAHSSV
jgi:hypothetical protein